MLTVRDTALACLFVCAATYAGNGLVASTPYDNGHLLIVRSSDFRLPDESAAASVNMAPALFDHQAIPLSGKIAARIRVLHPGSYNLWVRIGARRGQATQAVRAKLVREADDKILLNAVIGHGRGGANGGPAGYTDYRKQAQANTGGGSGSHLDDSTDRIMDASVDDGDDLFADLQDELQKGTVEEWIHLDRLDKVSDDIPFYWWKAGRLKLDRSFVRLELEPVEQGSERARPVVDAAFLGTYDKVTYPFSGDIAAVPATYVRFRLDRLPPGGIIIRGTFQTHRVNLHTVYTTFAADGLDGSSAFTKIGYTPWFRLQDIEDFPAFVSRMGGYRGRVEMDTAIVDPKRPTMDARGYDGATEFATFPHQDFVARRFKWSEPEGLYYIVPLDCNLNLHALETARDAAQGHYEQAVRTVGHPYPLARPPLYFMNARGMSIGSEVDYLAKTLRLLGFNSTNERQDPMRSSANYGWYRESGSAAIPRSLPFNEQVTREFYRDEFRDYFKSRREFWKGVPVRYMVDEPGEALRTEMGGPVWRYQDKDGAAAWVDPVGGSILVTKSRELSDCVLEGVFELAGGHIELRVGVDEEKEDYWFWRMGTRISPGPHNLIVGKHVPGARPGGSYQNLKLLGRMIGKHPFKIVYSGNNATLFVKGEALLRHSDIRTKGGFAIAGDKKLIHELRLRPIRADESTDMQDADQLNAPPSDAAIDLDLAELAQGELPDWAKPLPMYDFVKEYWEDAGGVPGAQEGFRRWLAGKGLAPEHFGKKHWDQVRMLTLANLVRDENEAREYYWSRRYTGYLTPRMFYLAADAFSRSHPAPPLLSTVALSGGCITYGSQMSLDMFELANQGHPLVPGISDWIFYSTWRRDSHQQIAFSLAIYNAGARRYGGRPVSLAMMHCVFPSIYRAYTVLANQAKVISFYGFGPLYANIGDSWSDWPYCYSATSLVCNRAAQADDIVGPGLLRPSRVAMLYAHSTEYWDPAPTFGDRISTFLGLAHEYFQPDLVTEQQIVDGALAHYDALYVVDPNVAAAVQDKISEWVPAGGLLWTCADALTRDEYNRPADLVRRLTGWTRRFPDSAGPKMSGKPPLLSPSAAGPAFQPHTVVTNCLPDRIECPGAIVRATYDGGGPAWVEKDIDKGKVVYVGHRAGLTYKAKRIQLPGFRTEWTDTGRSTLVQPLHEAGIERELTFSHTLIMATALSTDAGTAVIIYNMRPGPVPELTLSLREPKRPHNVQMFEGLELKDVPFTFEDGWLTVTLKDFDEAGMVIVRRTPAPGDKRMDDIRERAEEQLTSSDPATLSAGMWFAGFNPEWGMADRILPHVQHRDWRVRRSAAEALGRLGHAEALGPLLAALKKESDAHVTCYQLRALAALDTPKLDKLCRNALGNSSVLVRREALALLGDAGRTPGAKTMRLFTEALDDSDQRIRRQAMEALARHAPRQALKRALTICSRLDNVSQLDSPVWAEIIASNPKLLALYVKQTAAGPVALLIRVAARVRDPALAAALLPLLPNLASDLTRTAVTAVNMQNSPDLVREIMRQRDSLPDEFCKYLPLLQITTSTMTTNLMPQMVTSQ